MPYLRSLISIYRTRFAIILSFLTAFMALDIWAYQSTTHWMEHQFHLFQQTCQAHHSTLATAHIIRQGWPLGASLILSDAQLRTHYTTLNIATSAPSMQWGGTWGTWLWAIFHGTLPPLHFKGLNVIKIVHDNTTDATFRLQNIRVSPSLHSASVQQSLNISLDGGTLSSDHLSSTLYFTSLAGTVYWNTHATAQDSQLAVNITSHKIQLSHVAFPFNTPLSHTHLIAALPGCTSSIMTSLARECTLRLHNLSTDIASTPSSHIILGGKISVPEGNGTLTLQINHWQDALITLLKNPATSSLSPALIQTLQHTLTPQSLSTSTSTQKPLSISLSLSHGLPAGLSNEQLRTLQQLLSHTAARP